MIVFNGIFNQSSTLIIKPILLAESTFFHENESKSALSMLFPDTFMMVQCSFSRSTGRGHQPFIRLS